MKNNSSYFIAIVGFVVYFVANLIDLPAKLRLSILGVTIIIYIVSIITDVVKNDCARMIST